MYRKTIAARQSKAIKEFVTELSLDYFTLACGSILIRPSMENLPTVLYQRTANIRPTEISGETRKALIQASVFLVKIQLSNSRKIPENEILELAETINSQTVSLADFRHLMTVLGIGWYSQQKTLGLLRPYLINHRPQ
jgi:hypothetical protein